MKAATLTLAEIQKSPNAAPRYQLSFTDKSSRSFTLSWAPGTDNIQSKLDIFAKEVLYAEEDARENSKREKLQADHE
jgi:hypothetical protein